MREPRFWYPDRGAGIGLMPRLLAPIAMIYRFASANRQRLARPEHCAVPVICIGNVTAGGAGKTPVALFIGRALQARGEVVHFLSRGYGGTERGPLRVDPAVQAAEQVGDEPILLSALAPTWVAADRPEGAAAAVRGGASIIVMDDGLQNPHLAKDFSILVIDAGVGVGNGRLIPAGPLREPIDKALAKTSAVIAIGRGHAADGLAARAAARGIPVFKAALRPLPAPELDSMRVVAFAGIGRPEKFFRTLREMRVDIIQTIAFPDHHAFTDKDAIDLMIKAREQDAHLITTQKDAARLLHAPQGSARAQLAEALHVLPIELVISDFATLQNLMADAIRLARKKPR